MPTVYEHIIEKCFEKTWKTVPMFKKARKEYNGGPTVDGDER